MEKINNLKLPCGEVLDKVLLCSKSRPCIFNGRLVFVLRTLPRAGPLLAGLVEVLFVGEAFIVVVVGLLRVTFRLIFLFVAALLGLLDPTYNHIINQCN